MCSFPSLGRRSLHRADLNKFVIRDSTKSRGYRQSIGPTQVICGLASSHLWLLYYETCDSFDICFNAIIGVDWTGEDSLHDSCFLFLFAFSLREDRQLIRHCHWQQTESNTSSECLFNIYTISIGIYMLLPTGSRNVMHAF